MVNVVQRYLKQKRIERCWNPFQRTQRINEECMFTVCRRMIPGRSLSVTLPIRLIPLWGRGYNKQGSFWLQKVIVLSAPLEFWLFRRGLWLGSLFLELVILKNRLLASWILICPTWPYIRLHLVLEPKHVPPNQVPLHRSIVWSTVKRG